MYQIFHAFYVQFTAKTISSMFFLQLKKHNSITVVPIDMKFGSRTGFIPSQGLHNKFLLSLLELVLIMIIFGDMPDYNLRGSNWAHTMHGHKISTLTLSLLKYQYIIISLRHTLLYCLSAPHTCKFIHTNVHMYIHTLTSYY